MALGAAGRAGDLRLTLRDWRLSPDEPARFRLTLRRAALLHAIRHGQPPWWDKPDDPTCGIDGASKSTRGRRWIMCCGHTYAEPEIQHMVRLGWIDIEARINSRGESCLRTVAGPKIADAWQWPHYA